MRPIKNITCYTHARHSFEGYRLCMTYRKVQFSLYFSVRQLGSHRTALAAAVSCKAAVRAAIIAHENSPEDLKLAFKTIAARFTAKNQHKSNSQEA